MKDEGWPADFHPSSFRLHPFLSRRACADCPTSRGPLQPAYLRQSPSSLASLQTEVQVRAPTGRPASGAHHTVSQIKGGNMKRLSIVFAVVIAWQVGVARGQKPEADAAKYAKSEPRTTSLGDLKPTTEMWFYEQAMRQYEDPKAAVRRNAEGQAEQRQRRLAAMQWFGLSNARPRCSSRSDPQRIFAWPVLGQRLLSVSLVRQQRAGDHRPPRIGPVPAVGWRQGIGDWGLENRDQAR